MSDETEKQDANMLLEEFATNSLNDICSNFQKEISYMSKERANACLKIVKEYSHTNCGFMNYWMKDILIKAITEHLHDLNYVHKRK